MTFLLCVLAALAAAVSAVPQGAHVVSVGVRTSWPSSSSWPTLETAEFLADRDALLFWRFVDGLAALGADELARLGASEEAQIAHAEKFVETEAPEAERALHRMALATRTYSAKVELLRQTVRCVRKGWAFPGVEKTRTCVRACLRARWPFPAQSLTGTCLAGARLQAYEALDGDAWDPTFAWTSGVLTTVGAELEENLLATHRSWDDEGTVLAFDHVRERAESTAVAVFLYTDFFSGDFASMHRTLTRLVADDDVRYVLRPYTGGFNDEEQGILRPGAAVQGYGVQLDIKNVEYKVVDDAEIKTDNGPGGDEASSSDDEGLLSEVGGFLFDVLKARRPELSGELDTFRDQLLAEEASATDGGGDEIGWRVKDLGLVATQRILSASDPLRLMRDMAHNFPSLAQALTKLAPDASLKTAIQSAQQYVHAGAGAFQINGRQFDMESVTPLELLDFLKDETDTYDRLDRSGLGETCARRFFELNERDSVVKMLSTRPRVDMRWDEAAATAKLVAAAELAGEEKARAAMNPVRFVNNLEKDEVYASWPKSVQDLVAEDASAASSHSAIKFVGKNLVTAIFVLDLDSYQSLNMANLILSVQRRQMPARFGVVLHASSPAGELATKLTLHVAKKCGGMGVGLQFVDIMAQLAGRMGGAVNDQVVTMAYQYMGQTCGNSIARLDAVSKTKNYDAYFGIVRDYVRAKGFHDSLPVAALNGRILVSQEIERQLGQVLLQEMDELKELVRDGTITDETADVHELMLTRDGVLPAHSSLADAHPQAQRFAPLATSVAALQSARDAAGALKATVDMDEAVAQFVGAARYVRTADASGDADVATATLHVVADFTSLAGAKLLLTALDGLQASGSGARARLTAIHNPPVVPREGDVPSPAVGWGHLGIVVQAALYSAQKDAARFALLHAVFSGLLADCVSADGSEAVACRSMNHEAVTRLAETHAAEWNLDAAAFTALLNGASDPSAAFLPLDSLRTLRTRLGLSAGKSYLLVNGRVLAADETSGEADSGPTATDVAVLTVMERDGRGRMVVDVLKECGGRVSADAVLQTASVLGQRPVLRGALLSERGRAALRDVTFVEASNSHSLFHVDLLVNPLSKDAQKMTPIIMYLREAFDVDLAVHVNPALDLTEMPLQSYYRYVLSATQSFDGAGRVLPERAVFSRMPERKILTLKMDVANEWVVMPVSAAYDMDNLRLADVEQRTVMATYGLEGLLVHGHATWKGGNEPAQGVEVAIRTPTLGRHARDTIVMHNLGYFQMHTRPGLFTLGTVKPQYGLAVADHEEWTPHALGSMTGTKLRVYVNETETEADASDAEIYQPDASSDSYFSSLGNLFGDDAGARAVKDHGETINIFSVASGHLYERFLRIMIRSVIRHTESPVKFWFIENFLSPKFKDFLPRMAKQYGFEFQLVTYQWPPWLAGQTEKQRLIWSFKMLYLDVIFPLDVTKVIFIDADQIVRADVNELWTMDMGASTMAMTPFCTGRNRREETGGFRFWESGYWKETLRGRPYHISALFIVDLKRMRKERSGDHMRSTYDMMVRQSKDNLSNLDQELPQVVAPQLSRPGKPFLMSLPEEWLFCEAWCNDDALTRAKTIDLCNNPLTKENKIEVARRLVPEWTDYDNELRAFDLALEAGHLPGAEFDPSAYLDKEDKTAGGHEDL